MFTVQCSPTKYNIIAHLKNAMFELYKYDKHNITTKLPQNYLISLTHLHNNSISSDFMKVKI